MEAEEIDVSGKGDTPRPYAVDNETFATNWDRTFCMKAAFQEAVNRESNQVPSRVPVMPSDDPEESNQGEEQ